MNTLHPEDAPLVAPVRLVVVGASFGGVEALQALVSELPPDFPAALLVVLHIGSHRSIMPWLLSRRGALRAAHAKDGELLVAGQIRVGPPDHHLLVDGDGRLRLSRALRSITVDRRLTRCSDLRRWPTALQ